MWHRKVAFFSRWEYINCCFMPITPVWQRGIHITTLIAHTMVAYRNLRYYPRKLGSARFMFRTAISNLASLDAQQLPIYLPLMHSNYKITFASRVGVPASSDVSRTCLLMIDISLLFTTSHRNARERATSRAFRWNKLCLTRIPKRQWGQQLSAEYR